MYEGLYVVAILCHWVDPSPPGQPGVGGVQGGWVADDVDRQLPGLHLPGQLMDVVHPLPGPGDQDDNLIGPKVLEHLGHRTSNTGPAEKSRNERNNIENSNICMRSPQ